MKRKTRESLFIFLLAIGALAALWFVLSSLRIVVVAFMSGRVLGLLIL
ncbi:MAG: hypothetical protein MUO26_13230 [Methanotrichaceae archaeon]|nr:hypothetical protein [Methanotrichaceae archaeon]